MYLYLQTPTIELSSIEISKILTLLSHTQCYIHTNDILVYEF